MAAQSVAGRSIEKHMKEIHIEYQSLPKNLPISLQLLLVEIKRLSAEQKRADEAPIPNSVSSAAGLTSDVDQENKFAVPSLEVESSPTTLEKLAATAVGNAESGSTKTSPRSEVSSEVSSAVSSSTKNEADDSQRSSQTSPTLCEDVHWDQPGSIETSQQPLLRTVYEKNVMRIFIPAREYPGV